MRFEERVTILCAEALAAHDDREVRRTLAELRLVLHQHIEFLRGGVLAAFTRFENGRRHRISERDGADEIPEKVRPAFRGWQQVVQDLASEKNQERALQLTQELNHLLEPHSEAVSQPLDSRRLNSM